MRTSGFSNVLLGSFSPHSAPPWENLSRDGILGCSRDVPSGADVMEMARLGFCLVLPRSEWDVFGWMMLHTSLFHSHPSPEGCTASSPEHHPGMGSEITIFCGINDEIPTASSAGRRFGSV